MARDTARRIDLLQIDRVLDATALEQIRARPRGSRSAETTHEVLPITHGERLTIVSWYRG